MLIWVLPDRQNTATKSGSLTVFDAPEYSGCGQPKKPRYRTAAIQAQELAQSLPITQYRPVSWRQGSKAMMTSRFTAVQVRPAHRNLPRNDDGTLPAVWLLVEWPSRATTPTDYWLSTLPEDTPIEELVCLGKIRWRIEHD